MTPPKLRGLSLLPRSDFHRLDNVSLAGHTDNPSEFAQTTPVLCPALGLAITGLMPRLEALDDMSEPADSDHGRIETRHCMAFEWAALDEQSP
ncbi:hypothetical protein AWB78_08704 [Caballeronia calidae]|uniref:Uncharacterized protein n=2 Tax=Caballeronia calidae TaxID=1777139 RepID=A0A158EP46_9BURK|nr:hypothetical protein AWB78_08704 [Caballeronia calidae]